MGKLRSFLSLILVLVTTFLVSCSGPSVATPPPTYTPEKIAQIEVLYAPVAAARERMSQLGEFIENRNWVNTASYIHGPLGGIRRDIRYLNESLLVKDQKQAAQIAKELFGDFEQIDAAAKDQSYSQAAVQYQEALRHFDQYIDLIPRA
jgi:photosystem II protein PsbQ